MKTIDIPGGQATLREPQEMTERQRRIIKSAGLAAVNIMGKLPDGADEKTPITDLDISAEDGDKLFAMQDAAIVASLVSWTLDLPLPTMVSVQDLPGTVYDALAEATKSVLTATAVDFSPSPDVESPTSPSSASAGLLRDEATSTPPQPTAGESTDTESAIPA